MRPCVPCTRGTAWSGECPPCSRRKAWRPERPLWSPGCSRPHWLLSWEQWGAAGRDRWGPGFPFRLQLPFLVQEALLSAQLGCCSQGHGSQGWKPSVPDGRGESTFVSACGFCTPSPTTEPCVPGPWALAFPCPPRIPLGPPLRLAPIQGTPEPWAPPPTAGGDSGPALHLGRCVQGSGPEGATALPCELPGACCPLVRWSQVHFCICLYSPSIQKGICGSLEVGLAAAYKAADSVTISQTPTRVDLGGKMWGRVTAYVIGGHSCQAEKEARGAGTGGGEHLPHTAPLGLDPQPSLGADPELGCSACSLDSCHGAVSPGTRSGARAGCPASG